MLSERYPNVFNSLSENLKLLNGPISLDIDAVTQATYKIMLNDVSHKLGKSINRDDLTSYWEIIKIAERDGMSKNLALKFGIEAWNNKHVYSTAPAMNGVTDLLNAFKEIQIPHLFISSRPTEWLGVTQDWYKEKFPWIDPASIILGRPEGTDGGDFKAEMIRKYNVVLHLEDSLEEAEIIIQKTGARVLIVPQHWNESQSFHNPRIKYFGSFRQANGVWPLLKFLASDEAKPFLDNVAQSY